MCVELLPRALEALSLLGDGEFVPLSLSLDLVLVLFLEVSEFLLESLVLFELVPVPLELFFLVQINEVHTRARSHSVVSRVTSLVRLG